MVPLEHYRIVLKANVNLNFYTVDSKITCSVYKVSNDPIQFKTKKLNL